jgi:2,4-dienoyl-CoA reductase (NADPH2)
VHQIFVRNNICCAVNPAVGKESEPLPAPPQVKKRVLVVGGGPAGMASAINAATRGHDVTLVEKESRLGGSLEFAAVVRCENGDLVKYLIDQVKRRHQC